MTILKNLWKNTQNQSRLDLYGGRGALLAEETYHAFQVNSGDLERTTNGWVYGDGALQRAEAAAKIWVVFNSGMAHLEMAKPEVYHPAAKYILTQMGMVKDLAGRDRDIGNVGLFLFKGGVNTVPSKFAGKSIDIIYPPSYE